MANKADATRDAIGSAHIWIGIQLANLFQASAWIHSSCLDLDDCLSKPMRDCRLGQAADHIASTRKALAEIDGKLKHAADLIEAERVTLKGVA